MYQQSERSLDRVLKLETTQITNTFTITTRYDSTKNRTRKRNSNLRFAAAKFGDLQLIWDSTHKQLQLHSPLIPFSLETEDNIEY